jgi:hypothetical protein
MQCERVQPLIGAWQDKELDGLTAWCVGRHVCHCATCSAEVDELMRLEERLRAAAPLGRERGRSTRALRRQPWFAPTLASAAMVVIVAFCVRINRDDNPITPTLATASGPGLSTVRPGPKVATGPVGTGTVEGSVSGFGAIPQQKSQEGIAAAAEPTPVRLRRGRPPVRAHRTGGETEQVASNRRPRHRGPGTSVPHGRRRRTDEAEVILVAARALTPVEMAEREREASEFIYVAVTPPLAPPRSVQ